MPDAPARPADTLMMSLFHAALRRDLERAALLLENPGTLSLRRSRRLGRHLLWLMGNLRWHHEGEDHYLWPLLLEREPGGSAVLDAMKAEHDAIDEPLSRLESQSRGLVAGRTGPGEVLTALNALTEPLMKHLAHEEGEGMAIASRVLDHREWKEFEQRAWIDGSTATQSIRFLAWMADGVEWQKPLRRRAALPAPLYWSVVKPLSFIARVPGPSIWAGTPATQIKSRITPT
ncbi:hemerythrin domain-containing protein [Actinocorallia libanotica]|uniref:Hemerythrin-like domain-containing protein n=1 Tax=Actinocorallia libanotica TaxID=46162 RepID=A0ABN1QSK1_9ACTN